MNVSPQGWMNAVAMVQRHMVRIMQPISPHITQPYIDDLAVKGPKEKDEREVMPGIRRFVWDHVQDLCKVLDLLKEHNLTASGSKSRHFMSGATILGFVCDERSGRPDTKKANKILEWPTPFQTITEVRSFLGTCGFGRIFIKGFAAKTEQLRKLVRQGQDWEWGDKQESVIEGLKKEFEEGGLVLGVPDHAAVMTGPFVVETDAGPTALGGVLIQRDPNGEERPLRFESRTLNTLERNYSQFKRETLAVLHCLRIFKNYLFDNRFVLRVDPTALAGSLKNFAPSNPTIARWLTYIWMFDFELERILGNKNRADGLSRVDWDKNSQGMTEDTPPVDEFLDSEEDVRLHINSWSLAEEVVRNTVLDQEEVVEQEEGDNVIHEREDDDFDEGEIKEAFRAEEYEMVYLELGMLLSCEMRERDACARVLKMRPSFLRSSLRARELLHPRYVREVGAVVHLDLLAMPLGIGSYNFIFDARDNLSGFVDGQAIRTKTRETLARCIEEYYLRYPFVSRFVIDRESEFTCAEVKALLKRYEVIAEYTTAAHPQANAPVERGHSTITNLLAKWTDGRPNQWPNFLRVAFFVDNITVRRSTGYASVTLWYGRHATFPIESFLKSWRRQDLETDQTFEELLDLRARQIGAIKDKIEGAASRVAVNRSKDKFRWDKMARVRKELLKVGDVVLLYDSSLEKQWSRKLDKRWLGPYRVTRCREHGAYQIEELNGTTWKDWVSGSRLKKFVARDEKFFPLREDRKKEHRSHRHERARGSGGPEVPPQPAQMEVDCPMPCIEPGMPHEPHGQDQREEQSAQEKELDRKERSARDQEIKVQLRIKNLAELHERMRQGKEPEQVDGKSGQGACTQEEDLPLFSGVWVSFDKLMDAAGRSGRHHQEMGVKLVSTDLLNLRGMMKEDFAAARASNQKVGERLIKVAQKAYDQRVEWEREIEDLKKGLERQNKEMEAVRADMEKVWAENEAIRQVNQTLNKVNDVLRAYLQAQQPSFQTKEAEWEKRIQDLEAKCTRQAPTTVVDWTEVQRFGIRERPTEDTFKCQKEEERAYQQEGEEIPLIDKEMLEPQGVLAEKGAEVEEFEWRLPAGLTLGQRPAMPEERPSVEAMGVEVQADQYDFSRSQNIAVRSIRLGFRDFARELVGAVGAEVGHRLDKTEPFCTGAIEGVKAAAPKEKEARPPRREPVKVKFPDSYSGKREENFDNWEANVKTYVHLQQVSPDQQVQIAIHTLRDEAASFARSLVRAANCSDDPVAYSSFTSLTEFLKLLRERFADVARSVKASDKLQTIHSRKWKSVRALKGTMDELVAVPDHGVTEGQLVNLFYRAMPEAFRGQFFAKSEDPATTYDSLSREMVAFEAKSVSLSTFWHKDLDKGKQLKGRTISGQVKTKDNLVLTLDEGSVDEIPYDQIESGLEEADSGVGQGRSYAAVAAGGRPQGGRGQGQGGQASGSRFQGD
ncbi:hypothetical protein CBR_g3451 [Chara braunii]|uniref:Integrase catalytic domain-containing protein n=1 Tax=Chara braunii TaxID=69332 RepID=A0A388JR05_CHABU|nr:hypothetical protein CBR_g3451 [Chara braunii]|eukprot:GBG60207.1 hypothetical protein CBR_g3451 [Chara braunii]